MRDGKNVRAQIHEEKSFDNTVTGLIHRVLHNKFEVFATQKAQRPTFPFKCCTRFITMDID